MYEPELFVRYHNGIRDYYSLLPGPERLEPNVQWWYGPTGTGKTHLANEKYPNAYVCGDDLKWFDGYHG